MDCVTASSVSSVCVACELVQIILNAEETTQLRRKNHYHYRKIDTITHTKRYLVSKYTHVLIIFKCSAKSISVRPWEGSESGLFFEEQSEFAYP